MLANQTPKCDTNSGTRHWTPIGETQPSTTHVAVAESVVSTLARTPLVKGVSDQTERTQKEDRRQPAKPRSISLRPLTQYESECACHCEERDHNDARVDEGRCGGGVRLSGDPEAEGQVSQLGDAHHHQQIRSCH